ncbi:MAG: SDR family oxidoreductase [Actinomycetota bacterium]
MRNAALITGAGRARGIAAAVARALARDGWDLALTAWRPYDRSTSWGGAPADDLVDELRSLGAEAAFTEEDLADPVAPARLFDFAEASVGPPRALVNAHAYSRLGGLLATTVDDFDQHMAVNARATLLLSAEFVRRRSGEGGPGRIVNFTSGLPLQGEIAYAASKGAIEWITVSAAAEVARNGITVNAVDPGPNDTGWMAPEQHAAVGTASPPGRVGTPADAAELVAWLCSERAGWVTGQVIHCDGGWSNLRG